MLAIAGYACLGLVWGWFAARLVYGTRWTKALVAALGLAAQGLLVPQVIGAAGLPWFAGGLGLSLLVGLYTHRALDARRRARRA